MHALKRRRNVLKSVKGYRLQRSKKERAAKDAIRHAGNYAFRDRKTNKRNFRQMWTVRINAGVRALGVKSYSVFIDMLKKKNIALDRKVMSEMAKDYPTAFERLVKSL